MIFFFFSSRRRHTRCYRDWSSDVCSSDLERVSAARPPAWDWLWVGLALLANGSIVVSAARITQRWEGSTPVLPAEVIGGAILTLLILEATRRAVSGWLSALTLFFVLYLWAGPWLPSLLHHRGFSF